MADNRRMNVAAGDHEARDRADRGGQGRPRVARMRKNNVSEFLVIDAATTEILGWTPDEMVGHRSLEFIHPDDQEPAIEAWIEMLATPGAGKPARMRHKRRDGSWLWVEITNDNRLDDPDHQDLLAVLVDISDEITTEDAEWLAKRSVRSRERLLDR